MINKTVGRLYFQQTLEMTHTYIYPCPGPINGCILNKIQHQNNHITNTLVITINNLMVKP